MAPLLGTVSAAQPLGIPAVPVGAVLAARQARTRPSPGVVGGVALAVAGTASFVTHAALGPAPTTQRATTGGVAMLAAHPRRADRARAWTLAMTVALC